MALKVKSRDRIESMSKLGELSAEALDRRSLGSQATWSSTVIRGRSGAFIDNVRYRWRSKKDFVISTLTCIFSVDAFEAFIQRTGTDASIYHYMIMFTFLGLPLYYMQLLLGQYTQLGSISLKYLCPLAHGVALILIMNLFLRTIRQSILLDEAVVLFITSMQYQLQWLICPPDNRTDVCYHDGLANCTNLCNGTMRLPADMFFNVHFLNNPETDPSKMQLVLPAFQKAAIHGICWFFVCVIIMSTVNHYIKVVTILRKITLILLFVLLSVASLPDFAGSLADLFVIRTKSFASVEAWVRATLVTVDLLALGRAFHLIHGSYLNPSDSCSIYAVMVVLFHFLLVACCCLFTTTGLRRVAKFAKVDDEHLHLILQHGRDTLFVLIPQSMGSMGIPQLWTCFFFALVILVNISQQLVHLTFMQMSLTDIYPGLVKYKRYGVILFSLVGAFISCFLLAPEAYLIYVIIVRKLPLDSAIVNVVLLMIFVCWIYGMQRFSDDVHFITGQPPAKLWKVCWYIIPLAFIFAFVQTQIVFYSTKHKNEKLVYALCLLIYLSPIPIVSIVEAFRFIKVRHMMGLVQPAERFGPPDPYERELRRIFNPRTETKCRRRMEVCKHRCLLDSKALAAITHHEIDYLTNDDEYDTDVVLYEELD